MAKRNGVYFSVATLGLCGVKREKFPKTKHGIISAISIGERGCIFWIRQPCLIVNNKFIQVRSFEQFNTRGPTSIFRAPHWSGEFVPIIKITRKRNLFGYAQRWSESKGNEPAIVRANACGLTGCRGWV
jgi:hypothetical protein